MMRVALLAPIDNSLYARLLTAALLEEHGVEVRAMAVRSHWNVGRAHAEFRRDGLRLVRKFVDKFLLGDSRYNQDEEDTLGALARSSGLGFRSLRALARERCIPYRRVANFNQPECVRFLAQAEPQVVLFTGGGLIRRELLAIAPVGILNCHSGMLPRYRGMDVVEWTAAEDAIHTHGLGASLHLMDSGVDTGPLLLHARVELKADDTFAGIRARIEALMPRLMLEGVRGLRDGTLAPKAQNPADGRQYYVMHPRVRALAERNVRKTPGEATMRG